MADSTFDIAKVRAQFPILHQTVNAKPLAYLDNAATTQKPESVINAITHYYRHDNSNVHRAVHELASRATKTYEAARDTIAQFFNAKREEVVFTRGTTEAINLVARSFLQPRLETGDEILLTHMEHHSNIVPWQLVAETCGAKIVVAPVNEDGSLNLDEWKKRFSSKTKMVALNHISNTLGTVNPVEDIVALSHARNIPVLVDGAQAIAHVPVDFDSLGADFYCVSAHKAYGPTGFGALIAKTEHLNAMPPWHGGGDMIETVSFDGSTWNDIPYKFEAGTPDMAGAVGFAAALQWISDTGIKALADHEHNLLEHATALLNKIAGLKIIGTAAGKSAIISFVMESAHASDIGDILNQQGVAIRTGHHCTMPLMARFKISSTARASFAGYNNLDDVEQLAEALRFTNTLFS